MQDEVVVLEPQADADASSDDVKYEDDSIDTSVSAAAEPVEVETEAEEVAEEPESEVDSSPAEGEILEEKVDTVPASVQERIDEVIASRRETEELLTAAELENQQLRKRALEIPAVAEPFKTLADFDFDEGRFQAYMASEIQTRSTAAADRAVSDAQARTRDARLKTEFESKEKVFAKTVKDYDEVAHDRNLPISESMAKVIRANEHGPEILYFLGSKTSEARRIAALSPVMSGFEMGKIHSTLITERVKAAKPKVTKAPPPVPKIKSGDAGQERGFHEGMSDKAFDKLRRKQIANR